MLDDNSGYFVVFHCFHQSSEEMYLKNVRNWLIPFLKKCEKYDPGSYYSLMKEYLVTMAKDDLAFCLQIFKASKANVSLLVFNVDVISEMLNYWSECDVSVM